MIELETWQFEPGDVVHNHFDVKLEKLYGTVEGLDVWLCHYVALDINLEVAFDPSEKYLLIETTAEFFGEEK